MQFFVGGILIYCLIILVLMAIKPSSNIHREQPISTNYRLFSALVCIVSILICTVPMGLNPFWTGEIHDYLNQYEQMANCFIDGHVYFNEKPSEELLAMPNPYSHSLREQNNIDYLWDHALFNGHYYMYFGIVPLLLLFVPFKLITGFDLASYHATQFFVSIFIVGIFYLFRLFHKLFFPKITPAIYLLGSITVSIMCCWYPAAAPALYSTAQSAAYCFACWSLIFYFKAVYSPKAFETKLFYGTIGATLGALTFGCRPSIALFNIIAIPLLVSFFKKYKEEKNKKILFCFIPFIVVGALLMYYNYIRFNNPFEFGQTYQLTIADQSEYADTKSRVSISLLIHSFYYHLIKIPNSFDLLKIGVFVSYPFLFLALVSIFFHKVQKTLWSSNLLVTSIVMYLTVIIIVSSIGIFSPFPLPRYRMDYTWILGIVSYMIICTTYQVVSSKKKYSFLVSASSVITIFVSISQFFYPWDENLTVYNPELLIYIQQLLALGF